MPLEPLDPPAIISASASLSWTSIPANSTAEVSVTVQGAAVGNSVDVTPASSPGAVGLMWVAYASAANTATARVLNSTAAAVTPTTVSWRINVS